MKPDTLQPIKVEVPATQTQPPTVMEMMASVVRHNITQESVGAMRELAKLHQELEREKDTKEFAASFVALQREMPVFVAKTIIPNRGKYEKFEDLWNVVAPLLAKHNFSASFSQNVAEGNRIVETFTLRHANGIERTNSFAVRPGKADTDTQADCKAATTAKRNAMCNGLNLVIRQDVLDEEHDAAMEGDPNAKISEAQAFELERRVQETNSNVPAFLKFAGAKSFKDIPANRYEELDRSLKQKEARGR